MPQLVPFYYISQITFAFILLIVLRYVFSKHIFTKYFTLAFVYLKQEFRVKNQPDILETRKTVYTCMFLLLLSNSHRLLRDKTIWGCFIYFLRYIIKLIVTLLYKACCLYEYLLSLCLELDFSLASASLIVCIILSVVIYMCIYFRQIKTYVVLKSFKFSLILHYIILALNFISQTSDITYRVYPLEVMFTYIGNSLILDILYYITLVISLILYIFLSRSYNLKIKDSYIIYYNYLSLIPFYFNIILSQLENISWFSIRHFFFKILMFLAIRSILLLSIYYIFGALPGVYFISVINIIIFKLMFTYNMLKQQLKEKSYKKISKNFFILWLFSIFYIEIFLCVFSIFVFFPYKYYMSKYLILCMNEQGSYDLNNLPLFERSAILGDEIAKACTDINNLTISNQAEGNGVELGQSVIPTNAAAFKSFVSKLNDSLEYLFSYPQQSTGVRATTISGKAMGKVTNTFPLSRGNDLVDINNPDLNYHRIHWLASVSAICQIYNVKYQWSLVSIDCIADPAKYENIRGKLGNNLNLIELAERDPEQYNYIINVIDRFGNEDFKRRAHYGSISAFFTVTSILDHIQKIEEQKFTLDELYRKSLDKMTIVEHIELEEVSNRIRNHKLNGKLPIFSIDGFLYRGQT